MKKFFTVCMVFLLLLTAACGEGEEAKAPPAGGQGLSEASPGPCEESPTELRFSLESDGFSLRAVYLDAGPGPAVLLIPGSGPVDEDETVGGRKPFAEIAEGLAAYGISTLRFEKRTFRYADRFSPTDGVEEEYLRDCRAALKWLRARPSTEKVCLLGHSLGGQIAALLAEEAEDGEIDRALLWNSTPRHLAEVCRDQYVLLHPENRADYEWYAKSAKAASAENARKDYFYYGASEVYWASYNSLPIPACFSQAKLPLLALNSGEDDQIFKEDLQLWQTLSESGEMLRFRVCEGLDHLGYPVEGDSSSFSPTLLQEFASFFLSESAVSPT